jgi:amino acid transporter
MSELEHSKRNRRLGLILVLLFIGLFAIVTAAIVTGSKAPQSVESVVSSLVVPVLGVIGLLLIIAAVIEIVLRIVRNRVRE